jgi:hypothetical protein
MDKLRHIFSRICNEKQPPKDVYSQENYDKNIKGDLCINRNNHQKPTFHPLGDFLNPDKVIFM